MTFFFRQINDLHETSAAIWISGPDANTFLNGQFTQELRISPGQFADGLWLNQKGKVLADSLILRVSAEEHLVFSARTPAAALRARIEDYLIADEVTLEDRTARFAAMAVWGERVGEMLPRWGFVAAGADANAFLRSGESWACPARLAREPGYWLLVPRDESAAWLARLTAAGGAAIDAAAAERARLAAGIPAVPDDIGPNDLPNEGGLETVAISYTKGCYLGQEVMARLKNLGQVRRRLLRVRGRGALPARGTALYQGDTRVGELRSGASDGDGFVAFAMLSLVTLDRARALSIAPGGAELLTLVDHG